MGIHNRIEIQRGKRFGRLTALRPEGRKQIYANPATLHAATSAWRKCQCAGSQIAARSGNESDRGGIKAEIAEKERVLGELERLEVDENQLLKHDFRGR